MLYSTFTPKGVPPVNRIMLAIGRVLYSMRIFMSLFYIGLVVVMLGFLYKFGKEVWKLLVSMLFTDMKKIDFIITALEIIDLVMVVQLLWVVSLAGYSLFVSSEHFDTDESEKPDWLDHVNTYNLKLKLAFAVISISGVHSLKVFLSGNSTPEFVLVTAGVHLGFVASAIGIAYAEYLTRKKTDDEEH